MNACQLQAFFFGCYAAIPPTTMGGNATVGTQRPVQVPQIGGPLRQRIHAGILPTACRWLWQEKRGKTRTRSPTRAALSQAGPTGLNAPACHRDPVQRKTRRIVCRAQDTPCPDRYPNGEKCQPPPPTSRDTARSLPYVRYGSFAMEPPGLSFGSSRTATGADEPALGGCKPCWSHAT